MATLEKISCSSCLKPLCEIGFLSGDQKLLMDERGEFTVQIKYIKCQCPYCGDASMPVEINSRYVIGPATKLADSEDVDSFIQLTRYTGSFRTGSTLNIKVEKNGKET